MPKDEWNNEGHFHDPNHHEDEKREIKLIIKDSLVIIVVGKLDDEDLRRALAAYMDSKGGDAAK